MEENARSWVVLGARDAEIHFVEHHREAVVSLGASIFQLGIEVECQLGCLLGAQRRASRVVWIAQHERANPLPASRQYRVSKAIVREIERSSNAYLRSWHSANTRSSDSIVGTKPLAAEVAIDTNVPPRISVYARSAVSTADI